MPVRIAHLSDLHYGGSFDLHTWRSADQAVRSFTPDVLGGSGGFVRNPREDHLRRAKAEAEALGASAGGELLVVAGNPDVFLSGIAEAGRRVGWYRASFRDSLGPMLGADSEPGFEFPQAGLFASAIDRGQVTRASVVLVRGW